MKVPTLDGTPTERRIGINEFQQNYTLTLPDSRRRITHVTLG